LSTKIFRPGKRLLVLGASGAVGSEVLRLAVAHPEVTAVLAPTRRPLVPHPKLTHVQTDFAQADEAIGWAAIDAVVCALGTTMKRAGTRTAFAAVDRDLTIALVTAAQRRGANSMALNSSAGASPRGNFYLRTKHQAEEGVRQLGFASYTVVRPALIDVHRAETRPAERAGLWLLQALGPLVPKRYRPVSALGIAHALLEAALGAEPGERVVESESICLPRTDSPQR
jgi:uncharacterized protein YbjT (DUF2867 family)